MMESGLLTAVTEVTARPTAARPMVVMVAVMQLPQAALRVPMALEAQQGGAVTPAPGVNPSMR